MLQGVISYAFGMDNQRFWAETRRDTLYLGRAFRLFYHQLKNTHHLLFFGKRSAVSVKRKSPNCQQDQMMATFVIHQTISQPMLAKSYVSTFTITLQALLFREHEIHQSINKGNLTTVSVQSKGPIQLQPSLFCIPSIGKASKIVSRKAF